MRTLMIIPMVVIVLATGLLASVVAGHAVTDYRDSLIAMLDVERLRVLLSAQMQLTLERVATNAAMAVERPMPAAFANNLAAARAVSTHLLEAALENAHSNAGPDDKQNDGVLKIRTLLAGLTRSRQAVDNLLALALPDRPYADIRTAAEMMVDVMPLFEAPVLEAIVHTTSADPSLAGLLGAARLAVSLREHAGRVANFFVAHITGHQPMDGSEIMVLRTSLGRVAELDRLLGEGLRIAAAGKDVEHLLDVARDIGRAQITPYLEELIETGGRTGQYRTNAGEFAVHYMVWSNAIVAVWVEVLRQATARVNEDRSVALHGLFTAAGSILAVALAVLTALVLLHRLVIVPVTRIGGALVRIASGERTAPLPQIRGPHEIEALGEAVEVLRQTALVADATKSRDRLAAQERATQLHAALATAQTVRGPAHQIEEITLRLAAHLELTRAEMATIGPKRLALLDAAAEAVRNSAATFQQSSAMADVAVAALRDVTIDGHLGEAKELASRLTMLDKCLERWDSAVKSFSQPVLVALQGVAEVAKRPHRHGDADPKDFLSRPFQDVQDVVATLARMRDAVTRAGETLQAVAREEVRSAA